MRCTKCGAELNREFNMCAKCGRLMCEDCAKVYGVCDNCENWSGL